MSAYAINVLYNAKKPKLAPFSVDDQVSFIYEQLQLFKEDPAKVVGSVMNLSGFDLGKNPLVYEVAYGIYNKVKSMEWATVSADPFTNVTKESSREYRYVALEYYKLIKKQLKHAFVSNIEKNREEQNRLNPPTCKMTPFHKARNVVQSYLESKDMPLSSQVLEPTAMPVDIASKDDLMDFFTMLSTNQPAIGKLSDELGVYDQYTRGAFYTDGRIDLCKQVVGPIHIETLMESFRLNPYVKHFLLGNNIIGLKGAAAIANFLRDKSRKSFITTWYLAGNDIDAVGMADIADALTYDRDCQFLWLKRNPIKVGGALALAKMLKINNTIRVLDLSNTAIMDEGCVAIFDALKYNTTLESIYIDANGLTEVSAHAIAAYFKHAGDNRQRCIKLLSMSINRIGDAGAIAIANELTGSYQVQSLTIGSNRIELAGLKALLKFALSNSDYLRISGLAQPLDVLDIGCYKSTADMGELPNSFCDVGAKLISQFILENTSLKCLGLHNTHITETGLEMIAAVLPFNKNLLMFSYEQASIIDKIRGRSAGRKILDSIASNVERLGMTAVDYKQYIRKMKHGKDIWVIDSIYRNAM